MRSIDDNKPPGNTHVPPPLKGVVKAIIAAADENLRIKLLFAATTGARDRELRRAALASRECRERHCCVAGEIRSGLSNEVTARCPTQTVGPYTPRLLGTLEILPEIPPWAESLPSKFTVGGGIGNRTASHQQMSAQERHTDLSPLNWNNSVSRRSRKHIPPPLAARRLVAKAEEIRRKREGTWNPTTMVSETSPEDAALRASHQAAFRTRRPDITRGGHGRELGPIRMQRG